MAIWQVQFDLICKDQNSLISNARITDALASAFEKQKSWSQDIDQYGRLDNSCIEVVKENDTVVEINVRIDLRSVTMSIIEAIVSFAEVNNLKILYNGTVHDACIEEIKKIIIDSKAYSYVSDPPAFLDSVSN